MQGLAEPLVEKPAVQWRRLIFTAHFAASWGERMWEFSAGLLLLQIDGGKSLRLPAYLMAAMLGTNFLLGSKVGRIIDHGSVITAPLTSLAFQSAGIALAALSSVAALDTLDTSSDASDKTRQYSIVGIIGFTCVAKLAALARGLSLEKRWPKALVVGDADGSELATLNGQLRRIDLTCKIMAPVMAGLIMNFVSCMAAGCIVAIVNVIAWPVEVVCLRKVHRDPWCQQQLEGVAKAGPGVVKATGSDATLSTTEASDRRETLAAEGKTWQLYFAQWNVWPSAFALSMLHLTVLSFGQLMTAYVMTLGVPPALIAGYRSMGEVSGVAATFLCPMLVKRVGAARSATVFTWMQFAMLIPSAVGASGWARDNLPPLYSSGLLVGGVAVSRLGLWGFDLSVSQLIQQRATPSSALASISGVQNSLESFFGASAAIIAVCFPSPSQFQYLAYGSVASVACAAVLHTTSAARSAYK